MDFLKIAKNRYSVRNFYNKPVEDTKIISILEAARIAPSASNRQPWSFIVVQKEDTRKLLHVCYNRDWIKNAPVLIVACGDHSQSWNRREDEKDHCDIDVAIAVDHITLAATSEGLGTCWVCAFDAKKCAEILDLPNYLEPIAIIPVGYPKDKVDINRHKQQRKAFNEIVFWENLKK
jgi:nitroreductase